MPDHLREQFSSWDDVRAAPGIVIAAPNVSYYLDMLRRRLPKADIRVFTDLERQFVELGSGNYRTGAAGRARLGVDAAVSTVLGRRPSAGVIKIPLAFPIARHDAAFAAFMGSWIDLKRKDGTLDALYAYGSSGRDPAPRTPRWSIIRNVLHWVD